jgi:hypothetical protein
MLENLKQKAQDMTSPSKIKVTMRAIVAIITMSGFVAMAMYLVMFRPSFENNESLALVGTVVGYLSAKADTIIGWYFGSSQSSMEKTDAMENLLKDDKLA